MEKSGSEGYLREVMIERDNVRFDVVRLVSRPAPHSNNPIVISVLKDENARLPDFLRHYREAGIERFALIDNGSTDGSFEYLLSQPDVDLFRKTGRFHWIPKQGWINRVIAGYGYRRWYIYVDVDELIVYDGLGLQDLTDVTRHAERNGLRRVRGFLIDMYADGPIMKSRYERGESLAAAYPFFDRRGYQERRFKEIVSVKGGPRVRVFGKFAEQLRPELTKYPLFTLEPDECVASPHHIWPVDQNFQSPRLLGILHFKFLPNLATRVRKAIEAKSYWNESFEYRCYWKAIEADSNVSMFDDCSARYETPDDLIDNGLIEPIPWTEAPSLANVARATFQRARARMRGPAAALGETSAHASAYELCDSAATPVVIASGAEGAPLPRSVGANEEAANTEPSRVDIDPSEFVGFLP